MANIIKFGGGGGASEPSLPDGATVTPVDVYATWLSCAGLTDTFGSLANVIASTIARGALCNNLNALRYMVRSTTTIMPAVLANSGWIATLDTCVYSSIVPTMTSNTAPSGECITGLPNPQSLAYFAFDGTTATSHSASTDSTSTPTGWIGYIFPTAKRLYKINYFQANNSYYPSAIRVEYSSDGTNWNQYTNNITVGNASLGWQEKVLTPITGYVEARYWRIKIMTYSGGGSTANELQFYGLDLA